MHTNFMNEHDAIEQWLDAALAEAVIDDRKMDRLVEAESRCVSALESEDLYGDR